MITLDKWYAGLIHGLKKPVPLMTGMLMLLILVVCYTIKPVTTVAVISSAIRQSTPLVLGALCGLLGERSGIMNIGIEGQMLMAAFIGFLVSFWTGNPLLAALCGVSAGAVLGLFLALMSITLKIDQIIGGTVINILSIGITGYFYQAGLTTKGKLQAIPLGPLKEIPLLGPILFNNPPITYLTIVLVFSIHFLLYHTPWGLRTRAVGEYPKAADTLGINLLKIRIVNLALGGGIAGLAGVFLILEAVGSFERGMTNGRGFVALAVMIFGKWTPFGAWGGALVFGLATAIQTQLQFAGQLQIPHQFIGMLPYLMTVGVLAVFIGRSRPPAGLGIVYEKE